MIVCLIVIVFERKGLMFWVVICFSVVFIVSVVRNSVSVVSIVLGGVLGMLSVWWIIVSMMMMCRNEVMYIMIEGRKVISVRISDVWISEIELVVSIVFCGDVVRVVGVRIISDSGVNLVLSKW